METIFAKEELKKGLCEYIVNTFCYNHKITKKTAHNFIHESSVLAVALEQLGMLSFDERQYAEHRSGILRVTHTGDTVNDISVVTFRDVINALGENNEENNKECTEND